MSKKLAIISDHIVTPSGIISGCVIIENGKITEIDSVLPGDFDGEVGELIFLYIQHPDHINDVFG